MISPTPCPSSRSRRRGSTRNTSIYGRGGYMSSRSWRTSCGEGRLDRVLEVMIQAARGAAEIALKYFRRGVEVTLKADRSPVTQADREAEQIIVEILGRAFPEHGFLGEELGARGSKEVRWIVDPIDGTRNFVRGIPIWAVLIALEERGEITAGVILNPVSGELWTARRGGGAFLGGERL